MDQNLKIGLVGACGTGKSELASRLRLHGFQVRHIAQEHSFAPKMWKVISNPDILIYLHVSYLETLNRKNFIWTEKEYQEQLHRLRHARVHADLNIDTDNISPDEVYQTILTFIKGL
jgi:deoxyadenosine/deoxycytidine kinase